MPKMFDLTSVRKKRLVEIENFRLRISETGIGYQARISGTLKWFHFRWLKILLSRQDFREAFSGVQFNLLK